MQTLVAARLDINTLTARYKTLGISLLSAYCQQINTEKTKKSLQTRHSDEQGETRITPTVNDGLYC